jgi:SAM-dependent methyltransferase
MLASVAARAARLGLADRVETRLVDLHEGVAGLGSADLVWASMVIHHVGDEAGALRGIRSLLEPGGLFVMVEFGDPLRVLPDDVDFGRPGLWERLDTGRATWLADMRAGLPGATVSDDYPSMLRAAGFEVLTDQVVHVDLSPPLDDRARSVASGHLRRMREHVEPYVDPEDLAVLDVLTDEHDPAAITRRPDALLQASRRLVVSRATDG